MENDICTIAADKTGNKVFILLRQHIMQKMDDNGVVSVVFQKRTYHNGRMMNIIVICTAAYMICGADVFHISIVKVYKNNNNF